jgi:hypothetical protein
MHNLERSDVEKTNRAYAQLEPDVRWHMVEKDTFAAPNETRDINLSTDI